MNKIYTVIDDEEYLDDNETFEDVEEWNSYGVHPLEGGGYDGDLNE